MRCREKLVMLSPRPRERRKPNPRLKEKPRPNQRPRQRPRGAEVRHATAETEMLNLSAIFITMMVVRRKRVATSNTGLFPLKISYFSKCLHARVPLELVLVEGVAVKEEVAVVAEAVVKAAAAAAAEVVVTAPTRSRAVTRGSGALIILRLRVAPMGISVNFPILMSPLSMRSRRLNSQSVVDGT